MTKQPTSHFSLSDLRKSIDEHGHPLFTLTKSEVEALVSRLEFAERELRHIADLRDRNNEIRLVPMSIEARENYLLNSPTARIRRWLASLEAEG